VFNGRLIIAPTQKIERHGMEAAPYNNRNRGDFRVKNRP
jgi:hypothetical protein